jgi:hypothetical protein
MKKREILLAALAAALGLGGLTAPHMASADNVFNSMNPFKWFFGRNWDDDYDRPYHDWGYGWGGPYGWGAPWAAPGAADRSTVIVVQGESESLDNSAPLASARPPQ